MIRPALAWLTTLAAAGVASASLAQTSPPAVPTAPPAPAAAPAPPPAAAPAPTPPAAVDAAPAPVAPQPVAPPPLPAPTGQAAYLISLIDKACTPLVGGQDIKTVAAANGLKKSRDTWNLVLPGVQHFALSPPTLANPHVCSISLTYDVDQTKPLVDALFVWAVQQTPSLPPLSSAYQSGPGVTSWSWALDTDQGQEGLVFTAHKTPDGKPLAKNADMATVLFSKTTK